IDYDFDKQNGNGFSFKDFNAESLMKSINRALNTYENKDEWGKLVKRALECDFSWQRSAEKYIDLYMKAMH
ncbi:MAG: starch synthase, partial [Eubacteriales bacterium]|nr:starch synthase [Eubacteriales bacterium]